MHFLYPRAWRPPLNCNKGLDLSHPGLLWQHVTSCQRCHPLSRGQNILVVGCISNPTGFEGINWCARDGRGGAGFDPPLLVGQPRQIIHVPGTSLSLDKCPREFYDPWPRDVRVFRCYDSSANTKFNVSYHIEIVSRYIYNSISGDLYNVTI